MSSQTKFRKTDFIPTTTRQSGTGRVVIAIDGPAASGKGTLARRLAERLDYAYLDTGALYRAVAMATLELGGNCSNSDDVHKALKMVQRKLTPELLASSALRTPEVSDGSSKVAAMPEVRAALLDVQREYAHNPPETFAGAVLDGRDIGTVVCPDADIKLFITASVEERARRRFAETKEAYDGLTPEKVEVDLRARDARDEGREHAPTKAAKDAYVLDTTTLSVNEVLEEAMNIIRSHLIDGKDAAQSA